MTLWILYNLVEEMTTPYLLLEKWARQEEHLGMQQI